MFLLALPGRDDLVDQGSEDEDGEDERGHLGSTVNGNAGSSRSVKNEPLPEFGDRGSTRVTSSRTPSDALESIPEQAASDELDEHHAPDVVTEILGEHHSLEGWTGEEERPGSQQEHPETPAITPSVSGLAQSHNTQPSILSDALGYLDQVKVRFSDDADVYNRFLQIMKDFKAEKLDVLMVVKRVAVLFRGHPSLIQGFNIFLPKGYVIEIESYEGRDVIEITDPSGLVTRTSETRQATPVEPPVGQDSTLEAAPKAQFDIATAKLKQPVEFNHAISYVNRIKNRFAHRPEIYMQFLEILQSYQRESKPIQDVYLQVTELFRDAPDLLEDFQQFLPESSAKAQAQAQAQASVRKMRTIEESDEPYCYCQTTTHGEMFACDDGSCKFKWFHPACLNLVKPPSEEVWYCPACKARRNSTRTQSPGTMTSKSRPEHRGAPTSPATSTMSYQSYPPPTKKPPEHFFRS
jgi:histone deacetylase complex regulatory component SIN3